VAKEIDERYLCLFIDLGNRFQCSGGEAATAGFISRRGHKAAHG
jgi:hypothetical protein